jgi:hypothetical protein
MYHEDEEYYNANEVDSDSDSETFFSEVSIQKRAKRIQEEYKMSDPGFCRFYLRPGNKKKVECYKTSNMNGALIRDAVTGIRYNHRVGTGDEQLYYKVSFACQGGSNRDGWHLYYENPERMQQHLKTKIKPEMSLFWRERYNAYRMRTEM